MEPSEVTEQRWQEIRARSSLGFTLVPIRSAVAVMLLVQMNSVVGDLGAPVGSHPMAWHG